MMHIYIFYFALILFIISFVQKKIKNKIFTYMICTIFICVLFSKTYFELFTSVLISLSFYLFLIFIVGEEENV